MRNIEKLMRYENLPVRKVTRAEFIAALTARGETLANAELQANVSAGLGSRVLVGEEYLEIEP